MKKLFFIISIFFISISTSYAVFFIDGQGDYMATGEFKPVTGFTAGIGFGLTDDVNILIRSSFATNTENADLADEIKYEYSALATCGIEYVPPVDFFEEYRILWKSSIHLGASEFRLEGESIEDEDLGPSLLASFHTGLQYNFTQIISPYFDLGYHKSFYKSGSTDVSIKGWQVAVGIRFYIFGSRDFNNGYQ